jgi:hypothetical protein
MEGALDVSNDEWVAQRRSGGGEAQVAEVHVNNTIYIGRASFRMELSPLDLDGDDAGDEDHGDGDGGRLGAGDALGVADGDDGDDAPPLIAYADGEIAGDHTANNRDVVDDFDDIDDDDLPTLVPRTGVAQLVSVPVTMSRGRLAAWGGLAFAAGLWVAIGTYALGGAGSSTTSAMLAVAATTSSGSATAEPPEIVALDSIAVQPAAAQAETAGGNEPAPASADTSAAPTPSPAHGEEPPAQPTPRAPTAAAATTAATSIGKKTTPARVPPPAGASPLAATAPPATKTNGSETTAEGAWVDPFAQ